MRALLFLLFISVGLTACDSFSTEAETEIEEDADKDIVPPTITKFFPENDTNDFEVDSLIRFTFSELMNLKVLKNELDVVVDGVDTPSGIILYSGSSRNENVLQPRDERPIDVDYTVTLGVGIDPVTKNEIDIDVTALTLQHESGRFALNNLYTVFIPETVIDLADDLKTQEVIEGNMLGEVTELLFTTEDGEWKTNSPLSFFKLNNLTNEAELLQGGQFEPTIAANKKGDVMALWKQANGGGSNDETGIWASRYMVDENDWVSSQDALTINAEKIDKSELGIEAFAPKIAINQFGQVAATWYQAADGNTVTSIWVNMIDRLSLTDDGKSSYAWGVAEEVSAVGGLSDAVSPEIGIDADGNILTVWLEADDGVMLLKGNYYDTETNEWLAQPFTLNDAFSGDAKEPALSFSSNGVATIAWSQQEGDMFNLYARRFNDKSWGQATKLNVLDVSGDVDGSSSKPSVAMDTNNDSFVLWQQNDGKRDNIWSRRFTGGVWTDAVKMEFDDVGDAKDPLVVFGAHNQAFASWVQATRSNGILRSSVVVKYFSPETNWGENLTLAEGNDISEPKIKFDYEGNAVAVWSNAGNIERSRYSKLNDTWSRVEISAPLVNGAKSVGIVPLLVDGRFINIWTEFKDGSYKLISALFTD